jgi:hypothetical protein
MAQRQEDRADGASEIVPLMRPGDDEVLIRMYGQGLGDCFLLAFPRRRSGEGARADDPDRPVYVLIDCGVLGRTPDPGRRMQQVVADIRRTTRDDALPPQAGKPMGHLDLLIVTHEHWDHLSGFIYAAAREEWERIQVDALWTSWTAQDNAEGLAGVLGKLREQQQNALKKIAAQSARFGLDDRMKTALDLLEFLADSREFALSTRDGLDFAKQRAQGNHRCCDPGEVLPVPGTDTVAYVLGPPQNWTRLSKMDPTPADLETYESEEETGGSGKDGTKKPPRRKPHAVSGALALDASLRRVLGEPSSFNAFVTPLLDPPAFGAAETEEDDSAGKVRAEADVYERSFPFDRTLSVPIPAAEAGASTQPGAYPALESYFDEINHWRRIDQDWLLAAEGFALWVDSFVNNTSLVLAFELPTKKEGAERKVLLFVADAQVGNWLSWDEIGEWKPRDDAQPAQTGPADAADLLKRTVFYKVGHHGSHNATLKAKGVERMRSDGTLTAFVPVSPAVAHRVGWDEMPLTEILDALAARTNGRVVFPDGNVWPAVPEEETARVHRRIGLSTSPTRLPAKVIAGDDGNEQIEGEVPLWVQIAVPY